MTVLKSLLSKLRTEAASAPLPRVAWAHAPALVYAIGDIHGCLDQLLALEALIAEDARGIEGEKYLVCLGDYVDRGPKSAQVIEHMLAPPPAGFGRICLRGNHEDMLLGAATGGVGIADWLYFGGEETMQSYGMPEQQAATLRGERRPPSCRRCRPTSRPSIRLPAVAAGGARNAGVASPMPACGPASRGAAAGRGPHVDPHRVSVVGCGFRRHRRPRPHADRRPQLAPTGSGSTPAASRPAGSPPAASPRRAAPLPRSPLAADPPAVNDGARWCRDRPPRLR